MNKNMLDIFIQEISAAKKSNYRIFSLVNYTEVTLQIFLFLYNYSKIQLKKIININYKITRAASFFCAYAPWVTCCSTALVKSIEGVDG